MTILLDTHALLWYLAGDTRLSQAARTLIDDPDIVRLVSIATLWEIATKVSLGKLTLSQLFEELFPEQLQRNSLDVLHIWVEHLVRLGTLPFHHRDPFDRLLIAQALVEGIPIIGVDAAFDTYGIARIW